MLKLTPDEEAAYSGSEPQEWWTWIHWELAEIGRLGLPLQMVEGWRYGNLPVSYTDRPRSYNSRDAHMESGISFYMDGSETDLASSLFIAARGESTKVRVRGILNPLRVGSDKEPLLLIAEVII